MLSSGLAPAKQCKKFDSRWERIWGYGLAHCCAIFICYPNINILGIILIFSPDWYCSMLMRAKSCWSIDQRYKGSFSFINKKIFDAGKSENSWRSYNKYNVPFYHNVGLVFSQLWVYEQQYLIVWRFPGEVSLRSLAWNQLK